MTASEAQSRPDRYLDVKELTSVLGISKSSVYRMIERREIAFYRIRSGLRFLKQDIDEYLQSCRFEAINENDYASSKTPR